VEKRLKRLFLRLTIWKKGLVNMKKNIKLGAEAVFDKICLDSSGEYMINLVWDGTDEDALNGYWNKKSNNFGVFSLGTVFKSLEEVDDEIKELKMTS